MILKWNPTKRGSSAASFPKRPSREGAQAFSDILLGPDGVVFEIAAGKILARSRVPHEQKKYKEEKKQGQFAHSQPQK
jgi:hypothetical protein